MTQECRDNQSRGTDSRRETISVGGHVFSLPARTRSLLYLSPEEPPDMPLALTLKVRISLDGSSTQLLPPAEPSTVYLKVPVTKPADPDVVPTPGYYPAYVQLSPDQKWIYLNWLSNVSQRIDIGYVFLHYYGLERRLVEGEFDLAFDEVLFLRDRHEHSSFSSYSSLALLVACTLRNRPDRLADAHQSAQRHLPPDSRLLLAHMRGSDLTARDLMELGGAIAGVNRRYINTEHETFESALSQSLAKRYGDARFPFASRYAIEAMPKRRHLVFANVSLPADIRECELPSFLEYQPLLAEVKGLLSEAHEEVKVMLRERRRLEPEPGSTTKTESSQARPGGPAVTCPYCGVALDIEPKAKRKCPACGETMYVKRRPDEQLPRFVTKQQADEIDLAWEQHQRQKRIVELEQRVKDAQQGKDRYQELTARAQLEAELGHNDEAWAYFSEALTDSMKKSNFGLYRNAKLDMAMLAEREKRYQARAQLLSEVAYLDFCRCTNAGAAGRPAFDAYINPPLGLPDLGPDSNFAPGVLGAIQDAMKGGQIDLQALRGIFMSAAQQIHQSMKAPYPPEDAWTALEKALARFGSKAK